MTNTSPIRRPIRSYVLREGRITEGQRRAFEQAWPRYGIEFDADTRLDLPRLFANQHPVCLEIGFGNGAALAHMAASHPETNYLGIEVHRPGVGHLLGSITREGLENVRVLRHDAVEVLRRGLEDASLEGVYLLFPDPWHKKRHHKRRIVQPEFLRQLARVIRPGGFVHMATDWEDYALHMLKSLETCPGFSNSAPAGGFTPRPAARLLTRFEQRGQRLGHGVWDLVFRRD